MTISDLESIKKIHFIGIGGIGISAIARMMLLEGKEVTGSDRSSSLVTQELEKLGAKISYEHKAENIEKGTDLVVYTIAVPPENLELVKAKELGIKTLTYPEMLGLISASKYTIAVSGTHGKTTTTAMIAKVLVEAGLDPTVIVGSFLKDQKSNFVAGRGGYFVVEACEYKRSFLNLNPKIVVITNIDNDHLDYYKDLADIQSAFKELLAKVPEEGFVICDPEDEKVKPALEGTKCQIIDYTKEDNLSLELPGLHNVINAKAALSVSNCLGVDEEKAKVSLQQFSGTWRRFDFRGETKKGALVFDDYAHHPTEIKAALLGAREFMKKKGLEGKLLVAFQPHLYSRTKLLLPEFVESLKGADKILLAPIYAAREEKDPEISSEILAAKINSSEELAYPLENLDSIKERLEEEGERGDLLLTMGAGELNQVADAVVA